MVSKVAMMEAVPAASLARKIPTEELAVEFLERQASTPPISEELYKRVGYRDAAHVSILARVSEIRRSY